MHPTTMLPSACLAASALACTFKGPYIHMAREKRTTPGNKSAVFVELQVRV